MRPSHAAWSALVFSLAGCSSPAATGGDAAPDAADVAPVLDASDVAAPDVPAGPLMPRCEETESGETPPAVPSTLVGTLVPGMARVPTPDGMTNPSTEAGELRYRAMGFDRWTMGAGEPRVRRTELADAPPPAPDGRRSIGYFVHLSDFQLVDDESPARAARADAPGLLSGAMRPQEALVPRAMSAMNRTLAAIERAERPYQFGVVTGDCADSAQLNELRWVRDVMDGARGVRPDSGARDDLVPGADNDAKDPFDAVAFPAPWLYIAGNHDVEVIGNFVPTEARNAQAVGVFPTLGTRDYRLRWGAVTTSAVPADPDRRLVGRADIVRELRASPATPGPVGHGFAEGADVALGAHYVYDAIPGLLRVLALDSNDPAGGSDGLVRRATVDGWLRPELERAARDGVLVALASHHPTTSIGVGAGISNTPDPEAVPPAELERLVASHAHVVAWLVGHEHANRVRPIRGADAAHPGYWEVQTSALSDWPAQGRVVELVDNGDGTLSLLGTLVDFAAETCLERRYRRLTLVDYLAGWSDEDAATARDHNVELVLPVPATARARVAAARATGAARIESDTTLRGMR